MINDYRQPEEFLMDDTFKKYCEGSDQKCIEFWEKWIADNPSKAHLVEQSKYMYQILSANITPLNVQMAKINEIAQPQKQLRRQPVFWYAAAACFFLVLMAGLFYRSEQSQIPVKYTQSFQAGLGRKKKIILPDGTKVYLNSGSEIKLEEGFNTLTRSVELTGEAYFEVAHNKQKPFKVLTEGFKVTVLGTVFNLKAYSREGSSEASLVKGSIKVESNGGQENTVTLRSGQKIIFYKNDKIAAEPGSSPATVPKIELGELTRLDTTIVETAWVTNNLVFDGLTLKEIKPMLERWYGVELEFGDETVQGYQYTATFSKENIMEVLKSLREVKAFNYKMKGGRIIITK